MARGSKNYASVVDLKNPGLLFDPKRPDVQILPRGFVYATLVAIASLKDAKVRDAAYSAFTANISRRTATARFNLTALQKIIDSQPLGKPKGSFVARVVCQYEDGGHGEISPSQLLKLHTEMAVTFPADYA